MKIAFDIDGVILEQDLAMLRSIDVESNRKNRETISRYYYLHRKLQLNPIDYLADEDELYFITGRNEKYADITKKWQQKYFPQAKLIILNHVEPTRSTILEGWFVKQARLKAKALKENNIEVYFEDTAEVVSELRKLCPDIKIIQFGGRFREV